MINLSRAARNENQKLTLTLSVNDIVALADLIHFTPKKILEAGIGTTDGVQSLEFLLNGAEGILFEPNKGFYDELVSDLGHLPNIKIHNKALYKEKGIKKFYDKWACTFIDEMYESSGAKIQDNYVKDEKDAFECETDTVDNYDDGNIDILCLDCESCEWFVLEKLKSRPTIIQIETHSIFSEYKPYNIDKISQWLMDNDYFRLAINESDTICVTKSWLQKLGKLEFKLDL